LPSRDLMTPMNHKNAIPAYGTKVNANDTWRRRRGSVIHVDWSPPRGTAMCSRITTAARITANAIPAIAAARGVRSSSANRCSGPTAASGVVGAGLSAGWVTPCL